MRFSAADCAAAGDIKLVKVAENNRSFRAFLIECAGSLKAVVFSIKIRRFVRESRDMVPSVAVNMLAS